MNFERTEKNLVDNIKEAQLKLGYDKRQISMNYMNVSLAHLMGGECTEKSLAEFAEYAKERLGDVTFRQIKGGWCITVSAEGAEYVHNLSGYDFMSELIEKVRSHGTKIEDVLAIFRKYSENIIVKEMNNEEFDLLVYSTDGKPDDYYYCLTDEGCHVTYHRFISEDYNDLGF